MPGYKVKFEGFMDIIADNEEDAQDQTRDILFDVEKLKFLETKEITE